MYFRTILSSTLTILLVSGAVAKADERSGLFATFAAADGGSGLSLPRISLPKLFGGKDQAEATVHLAQTGDPRITSMEEQLRSLSGTVEELNFQILQLQEQIRKMQEDNEFRFQELEQKKTDAGATTGSKTAAAPAISPPAAAKPGTVAEEETIAQVEPEVIADNGTGDPAETGPVTARSDGPGEPPKTFGTITFDDKGNVTGGSVADQTTQSITAGAETEGQKRVGPANPNQAAPGQPQADMRIAALPSTDSADELYRNAYEFILSGDYGTAEQGFREHIERFPQDQRAADANFWLGEALLGQKKYREAAEVFLAANKDYPSSRKAPDMLLKLGVSLVGLDQRDVACATFAEIGKKYPDVPRALKARVKQEEALAAC